MMQGSSSEGMTPYSLTHSPVQHLKDQRHCDEEVWLVESEVFLECLHAAVHELGGVAEEEVLARALVDVPRWQQAQHDVTSLGLQEDLQVLDLCTGRRQTEMGNTQKARNEMGIPS